MDPQEMTGKATTNPAWSENATDIPRSREQSQSAIPFQPPDHPSDGLGPYPYNETNDSNKFSLECALYRRTKREMLANGWDEAQIFGRNEMDVDTLLLGFADPQESLPVPTWASKMVNRVLPAAPIPVRLASASLLTKMMRVREPEHPQIRNNVC